MSMERRTFRIFFWQKFVPLSALPVFALLLAISPIVDGWSLTAWIAAGVLAALAVGAYLLQAWLRSPVVLDEDGLTFRGSDGRQTWKHEKLLKVKQIGKYRVRMCYDPGIPDKHMHVTFDLFDSDGFTDALLDWYEAATGGELPELEAA
ncbi:MAG TPA: hypothetical protein VJP07_11170 [Dehalococcoidia bacterium]|nr:hypothetical protein [Dehalococcoidia bacterium]